MQDTYLATIIQYLIKILEKQGGESSDNDSIITKLDNLITAVSNIKISAESVNLNTDEVEDKLDGVINAIGVLATKLDTINTTLAKLDTINTNISSSNAINTIIKTDVATIKSDVATVKTNTATTATNTDATNTSVKNLTNKYGYLNPTRYKSVPAGDTTFANACVLCNITDENITVTVTSSYDSSTQSVVLVPGWNPIIVKAITGATENTLLYGW